MPAIVAAIVPAIVPAIVSDAGLADRSRAVFAERFPAALARMAQAGGLGSASIVEDDVAVDIEVDGQRLYGSDARAFATNQVAAFMANPLRLSMSDVSSSGLVSNICIRLVAALADTLHGEGCDNVDLYPAGNPTFLVVFGIGLGHHLEHLVRDTKARWLIVVEPLAGFIEHSFEVVDWPRLVEDFEARGGKVHVITEIDPALMVKGIVGFMNAQGIAYVDGAWVFTHYPHWAFAEARKRLHEAVEFAFINRGFFEDELRMMENAIANFGQADFRLLDGRPRLRRPEIAVVVGAGPSLDESFETLHRIRDRIVLFSCGTALRPLLQNGLVPDFQCELENVPAVHDVLGMAAAFGDLKRITLIGSATVDPRVPALFGESIFFFRDLISPTEIIGQPYRVLPAVTPTCVNLGLMAAAFLGFTDFVLFGTDCGQHPGSKAHAEGTVYNDVGLYRDQERARANPIEVDGNFGGKVKTNWIYDACRLMLGGAIGYYRLNVINCSDGAVIPGAHPCAPEALEIARPPVDRAAFALDVVRPLRSFAPGEMLAATDLAATRLEAAQLFDDLDALLADLADAEEADFAVVFDRVRAFVAATGDKYGHTESIIAGTLNALPRIGMFYGFRVVDDAVRRRLYARYIEEFRAIVAEMASRTDALFDELEDSLPAPSARRAVAGG